MRGRYSRFLDFGLLLCLLLATSPFVVADQPNIIFILSDDVGIGDLSPYGQQTIQTPNLEQLAAEGMQFSQMYSGAPVCSPSRAILMTGLHNGRHVNGNGVNLQARNETVAEVLQTAGYQTAGFGKWHLGGSGASLPTNQGFDSYYGILGGVAAWDHFNPVMQRLSSAAPSTVVNEPNNGGFTDDLVGAEAAQYVRDNAQSGQPFYAQVNFQLAHFDMEVPELEPYTVNQAWPESRKIFASMISRLDRLVGDVVAAVDDPNGDGDSSDSIADETLIVFASDNGTHIEPQDCCKGNHGPDLGVFSDDPHDPEFFDSNGPYRGWKRDLYDGGIKTPFIARWANTIAPSSTNHDFFGDFADFLPTAAELAGVDSPVGIDGESYAHVLQGSSAPTDFVKPAQYFEGGGSIGGIPANPARRALIKNGLKAIQFADGTIELFDLENDPTESTNLYPSMTTLADEMIAKAISEDTGQITYLRHTTGNFFGEADSWNEGLTPGPNTIASVAGNGRAESELFVASSHNVLGLDVGGSTAPVRLTVLTDRTLAAQNGVRVRTGSQLRIEQAVISTDRRVELFGGSLTGDGTVNGTLINRGQIAPDSMTSDSPPQPSFALRFDFSGIQDDAPLTNTSQLDPNLTLVGGFDYGPSTQPRSAGPDGFTGSDNGNEFNAGGFNTNSLAGAIAADDYLTFTVQSLPGFEMLVESVSYDLWRNGGNAANDYAILSSLDGFNVGNELAQLNNVTSQGLNSKQTFSGTYVGSQPTADAVEMRLYAWNANDNLASTHITAVSLNATFVLSDQSASFGETTGSELGTINLQGDYLQLETGTLSLNVTKTDGRLDNDRLDIVGTAHLDGILTTSIINNYVATQGDQFTLLTAEEILGQFSTLSLPNLAGGLHFGVLYTSTSVLMEVQGIVGDYNYDGTVDAADYTVWRRSLGNQGTALVADGDGNGEVNQADYLIWRANFGMSANNVSPVKASVPEPTSALLLFLSLAILSSFGRRITS